MSGNTKGISTTFQLGRFQTASDLHFKFNNPKKYEEVSEKTEVKESSPRSLYKKQSAAQLLQSEASDANLIESLAVHLKNNNYKWHGMDLHEMVGLPASTSDLSEKDIFYILQRQVLKQHRKYVRQSLYFDT